MNRRQIAYETVLLVERKAYPGIDEAIAGRRLYEPSQALHVNAPRNEAPRIEVTFELTLAAAKRVGEVSASLVFASARNPGGGFLRGAEAQEESIARSSALYACQLTQPAFSESHRRSGDLRYSHRVIYSPAVPV